jgi:hypothetical protein
VPLSLPKATAKGIYVATIIDYLLATTLITTIFKQNIERLLSVERSAAT